VKDQAVSASDKNNENTAEYDEKAETGLFKRKLSGVNPLPIQLQRRRIQSASLA
jgi:hypothetical protein